MLMYYKYPQGIQQMPLSQQFLRLVQPVLYEFLLVVILFFIPNLNNLHSLSQLNNKIMKTSFASKYQNGISPPYFKLFLAIASIS